MLKHIYLNALLAYRTWALKHTLRELARLTLLTRGTTDTETVTTIEVAVVLKAFRELIAEFKPKPEPSKPKFTSREVLDMIRAGV
jgi:hypothetical protein